MRFESVRSPAIGVTFLQQPILSLPLLILCFRPTPEGLLCPTVSRGFVFTGNGNGVPAVPAVPMDPDNSGRPLARWRGF